MSLKGETRKAGSMAGCRLWILAGFRSPPGSQGGVQLVRCFYEIIVKEKVASGSDGFPDFGAHGSELSGHAHPHWLCSGKEPTTIKLSAMENILCSVRLPFHPLNHPDALPAIVSLNVWAVMSNRLNAYYMLCLRLSIAQNVAMSCSPPWTHPQRPCPMTPAQAFRRALPRHTMPIADRTSLSGSPLKA
jgi:hypothetical protein